MQTLVCYDFDFDVGQLLTPPPPTFGQALTPGDTRKPFWANYSRIVNSLAYAYASAQGYIFATECVFPYFQFADGMVYAFI